MLKNSFHLISFENISVLDSYLISRYIIIIRGQVRLRVKSCHYYGSYGPFSSLKNVFFLIFFEKISVLDSYVIHRYIIIKYRSKLI